LPYLSKAAYNKIVTKLKKEEGYKLEGEYPSEGQAISAREELQIDGWLPRIFHNEVTKKWEVWVKGNKNW